MRSQSIWLALSEVPFEQRFSYRAGHRTRVLHAGSGDGTPVLLLHGLQGHAEAYARNICALSRCGPVIAPDFVGHGYSDPSDAALELDHYCEQVLALIDQLGHGAVDVVGSSLGGWVAARVAARHPRLVRRLVLSAPGGTVTAGPALEELRHLSARAATEMTEDALRSRLEWLMHNPDHVTAELVGLRRAIYSYQLERQPALGAVLHLLKPAVMQRNALKLAELAAIECPTLVCWGDRDRFGSVDAGRGLAEEITKSRFIALHNVGHWPQWENPAQFNNVVASFLSSPDEGGVSRHRGDQVCG
ncbi:MAG: alpha/beta fold hydrolase [Actinomycetota bacterium]